MSVTISHTMVNTVTVDGLFQVADTITASTNIAMPVYVYLTVDATFAHVATAGDMQAYLDTQGAAQTAGSAYYRQPAVTKAFAKLSDAVEFSSIIALRLKALAVEQNALLAGFTGTTTTTVTS